MSWEPKEGGVSFGWYERKRKGDVIYRGKELGSLGLECHSLGGARGTVGGRRQRV